MLNAITKHLKSIKIKDKDHNLYIADILVGLSVLLIIVVIAIIATHLYPEIFL